MLASHGRRPPLTDAQGQLLQDSITAAVAVVGAGAGALVGGLLGSFGPASPGRSGNGRRVTRGVIVGGLLGTALGTVYGHRTSVIALIVFEVHRGHADGPPERPWRGWS